MGTSKADKARNEELRKMLVELRDGILSKIAQEMGTKLDEDPRMSSLSTLDIGDLSQLDFDENIDYTLLNMQIERLREVEDALDRLEEGTYGICEECGATLNLERLKILPFTTYCVQCRERREQMGQGSKLKQVRKEEEFDL
jgi:DnaK suppressor protein